MKKVLLTLLIAVVLFGSYGCKKKEKVVDNKPNIEDDVAIFDNQEIDKIKFENAVIVYEEGNSTLTFSMNNQNEKTIYIENVNVKLYNIKNELIQEFHINIENNIDSGKSVPITQGIMKDISKATTIEYKINY